MKKIFAKVAVAVAIIVAFASVSFAVVFLNLAVSKPIAPPAKMNHIAEKFIAKKSNATVNPNAIIKQAIGKSFFSSLPQKLTPTAIIIAPTPDLTPLNALAIRAISINFSKKSDKAKIMTNDGRVTPKVAKIPPKTPPRLKPT